MSESLANQTNLQADIPAKNPPRILGLGEEGCVGVADGSWMYLDERQEPAYHMSVNLQERYLSAAWPHKLWK